ncbi:MAG: DUF4388 domain-containing protein [Planctomycetota bacterium]
MSLQGQIEEMGLGPIIQALSLNRYRGTLRIETEAGSRFFFISEGEIVLVRQVKRDPMRLGDLLIRSGHISEDQLQEALDEQKRLESTMRLGETLAKMNLVTPEQIEQAVRSKFEEDFLDLFLLDKGRFEFIFGLTPEALFAPDERLERITLSTSGLMMEAMRRVDEWQEMIASLGSFDTIYRNRTQSMGTPIENYEFEGVSIPKHARLELYELLDGTRSLREVIAEALGKGIASRLETFQYLHALEKNQLVKPLDFKTLLTDAKEALSSGDVQGAAKLIRAILTRKEKLDLGLVKRYLDFLKKQDRPRLAFDEARRFAAQALADEDHQTAITLYEEAIALYRNPEVVDRLFYALLRANQRKRAVEVGVGLREYLQSENDLSVATRVAQNLMEIDPEDPGVLELWGLILQRRERNEEAVTTLERALGRLSQDSPRRGSVIAAILELRPDREDLRDTAELFELRQAREQLKRERRRRWISIAATLAVAFLLWRGNAEVVSRSRLGEAERLLADAGEDPFKQQEAHRAAGLLLEGVQSFTTASGRAADLKKQVNDRWLDLRQEDLRRADELVKRRQAEAEAADARRKLEERRQAAAQELTIYRGLVGQKDYAGASAKALEILGQFQDLGDPALAEQIENVRVFALLRSKPSGATVRVGGKELGRTPQALPLEPGKSLVARVGASGYRRVELTLAGDGFVEQTVELVPGPAWQVDLPAPPLLPAVSAEAVVLATPDGKVRCFEGADGEQRWVAECPGQGALAGVALVGPVVVATRGRLACGLSLRTGKVEWELTASGTLQGPAAARVLNQQVALVAGGAEIDVLDAASGAPLVKVTGLPAAASGAPAGGDGWGFLPLADRTIGFPLALGGQRERSWATIERRWEQPKVVATGPLHFAPTAEALIVPVAKGTELRILGMSTGVVTPVAPSIGPLVGVAADQGTIFCVGNKGQLSSFRGDGLEILAAKPLVAAASGGPALVDHDLVVADDEGTLARYTRSGRRHQAAPVKLGKPLTLPLVSTGSAVVAVIGKLVYVVEPLGEK